VEGVCDFSTAAIGCTETSQGEVDVKPVEDVPVNAAGDVIGTDGSKTCVYKSTDNVKVDLGLVGNWCTHWTETQVIMHCAILVSLAQAGTNTGWACPEGTQPTYSGCYIFTDLPGEALEIVVDATSCTEAGDSYGYCAQARDKGAAPPPNAAVDRIQIEPVTCVPIPPPPGSDGGLI
jgi:hypothetical protein